MALREGEFILDGYAFGTPENDAVILASGLDTGSAEVRTQDANVRDHTLFGRDYLTGPTWGFTIGVPVEDADTVVADLARAWRNPAIRNTPGQLSTLQFKRNGREYVIFGRPRRFGLTPDDVASSDWRVIEADFRADSPYMYDNAEQSVTLRLGEQITDSGVILPETMPWLFGGSTASAAAVLNVQTLDPTPFQVIITPGSAPLSAISVEGEGWAIDVDTTVNPGSTLVIDTRTSTALVDGASVAGTLSRRTRLTARLWNGASSVAFTGIDSSGSATATVVWRGSNPIF